MRIVNQILLWTWELPQTLLGLLVLITIKIIKIDHNTFFNRTDRWWITNILSDLKFGMSAGAFLFIPADPVNFQTLKHEIGHAKQSRILGPLYLLFVGIPSVMHNIIGIMELKLRGTNTYFLRYYDRYPEKWADRLGNVRRLYVRE